MSKKLMALLMAALMLLSVAAACGKEPAPTPDPAPTPTPAPSDTPAPTPAPAPDADSDYKIYYTYLSGEVDTMNGMGTVQEGNDVPLSWCNSTLWRAVPNDDGMGYPPYRRALNA